MHTTQYARWQAERPGEADALVRPDGDRWWEQAQEYALSRGFHVLLESIGGGGELRGGPFLPGQPASLTGL
ncbi:hypothetical protein [Streptomyces sp. NPDC001389]|uniref:hypothetical protein n=1 Tax=Streptomyces sp. NPDC001389 TaxID=3364569 RepID=UPI00369024DD